MASATGWFEVKTWEETPVSERPGGRRLTQAAVSQQFGGDIEGEGKARWLMSYRDDGTAHFVGLQEVDATIGGLSGTFVLETHGDFDGTVASWEASVVPGSGTAGLTGLSGTGRFQAPHGSRAEFQLNYAVDN